MGSTREEQNNSAVTLRETGSKPSLSLTLNTRYFWNFDSCMEGRSFSIPLYLEHWLYTHSISVALFNGKARSEPCRMHLIHDKSSS